MHAQSESSLLVSDSVSSLEITSCTKTSRIEEVTLALRRALGIKSLACQRSEIEKRRKVT